jgi:hypothetical protein
MGPTECPETPVGTTHLRCVKSQKDADLIHIAAKENILHRNWALFVDMDVYFIFQAGFCE